MNNAIISKLKELKPILKERYGIEEFAVFRAKDFLKESLGKDLDMGTFSSMQTFIKNRIKKDFIYV